MVKKVSRLSSLPIIALALASASPTTVSIQDLECQNREIEVTSENVQRAAAQMLAAQSNDGQQLLQSLDVERLQGIFVERSQELAGRTPLNAFEYGSSGLDLCFSDDCMSSQQIDHTILFGCSVESCIEKSAAVIDSRGRLLAIATTNFITDVRSSRPLSEYVSFFSSRKSAEQVGPIIAGWHLMERSMDQSRGSGREPNRQLVANLSRESLARIVHRECVSGENDESG